MRLSELQPCWLEKAGARVGVMFKCPHCRKTWLTCFWVALPTWGEERPAPEHWEGQFGCIRRALDAIKSGEPENAVVPCKQGIAWTKSGGDTFDTLTLQPSLDASASGHWHGHITNGAIE